MGNTQSMYWLNIVLFSILDSDDEDGNDYIIARYLLENYDELSGATLSEISEKCNVSKAAISRFCKRIGLLDYIDLQMLIRERHKKVPKKHEKLTVDQQKDSYEKMLASANDIIRDVMNDPQTDNLINDILKYKSIYLFGHLQSGYIAQTFRTNLAILSKFCYCSQNWSVQKEKISNASDDDLIIVFSSTGDYFKRIDVNMNRLKMSGAKVYIVTFREGSEYLQDFINKIFIGDEAENPISNILMNMFVNYISYRFSFLISENETE